MIIAMVRGNNSRDDHYHLTLVLDDGNLIKFKNMDEKSFQDSLITLIKGVSANYRWYRRLITDGRGLITGGTEG